jgi:hypothetical protein
MSVAMTRGLPRCGFLIVVTMLFLGCNEAPSTDLSRTGKYAGVIGARYRTKAELYAHGISQANGSTALRFIWVAPVEQTGPEIAFRRKVPEGEFLRVIAVRKRPMPFENGLEFIVKFDGLDLPTGVEIVVPLYGYMKGSDGFLDQSLFDRMPSQ